MNKGIGFAWSFVVVGLLVGGCSGVDAGDTGETNGISASELTPTDEATVAKLNLPPGIHVAGALPTIRTTALPGVSPQNTRVGGGGGVHYYWSDTSYSGIFGRAGNYVDALGFHGANGDAPQMGGGGGFARDIKCNTGLRIVGIAGGAGNYVDRLGPMCGTPTTNGVVNSVMGGTGGNAFNYRCPLNTWVVAWDVAAGSYVDSLTVYCGS